MLLIFLLHFKGDVEAVRIFQGWVVVTDETTVLEEAKVPKAKYFGTSFLLLWDFDVLTRTHGKEKGKDGELQYGTLQLSQISFGNLSDDASGDGFLLLFFGVSVLVGSELSM